MMLLTRLFLAFFQVGLFAFGGGLAALPLIREQIVIQNGWMDMATFTDLVTIAEMTPGPITLNAATFVGMRLYGIPGALVATLGSVAPSIIIVLILARIYKSLNKNPVFQGVLYGLRPATVALIASAGLSIFILALFDMGPVSLSGLDLVSLGSFAAALFVLRKWKPSPILVILGSGIVGAGISLLLGR